MLHNKQHIFHWTKLMLRSNILGHFTQLWLKLNMKKKADKPIDFESNVNFRRSFVDVEKNNTHSPFDSHCL